MKIVPFYPNKEDNLHCLQACVCSVLDYFNINFIDSEVDDKTGFFGGPTWLPQTANWFYENNLTVKLVSPFDYERFSIDGEDFLKEVKGNIFNKEKIEGQYIHLDKIQQASKDMIENNIWEKRSLEVSELADFLLDDNSLAIAKTYYELLGGKLIFGSSHYVTIIKQYKPGKWLIHDPGPPSNESRKIDQIINNDLNILFDVLLISKK